MPVFPQYENAQLVEFANYRTITSDPSDTDATAITAASGDFIVVNFPVSSQPGDDVIVVTLPEVALGGPVGVKLSGPFGDGNSVVVKPTVADTVAGCTIEGFNSITLVNAGDTGVFASDGTYWWAVSKAHNTHDTW